MRQKASVAGLIILAGIFLVLFGGTHPAIGDSKPAGESKPAEKVEGKTAAIKVTDKSNKEQKTMEFSQSAKPAAGETIAVITTNQGTMKARLFTDIVHDSATNFIELAKQGKYSNVPFHRVIKGFMIQGGDFTNKNGTGGHSAQGPGTTIADEYSPKLKHIRGALSWAKTQAPKSIGSQFYIVHPAEGTPFLDHPANGGPAEGYSVFGQVYEGFEVLDKIATTPTDRGDKPLSPMTIESVTIETAK